MGPLRQAVPQSPGPHSLHRIASEEDVGAVRRAAGRLRLDDAIGPPGGVVHGQAEQRAADALLVATELASNVLRHAGGGYVLLRELEPGVELIAVDAGRGIDRLTLARLAEPLTDPPALPSAEPGAGLGVGLAAVRRRASEFDVYTRAGGGSVVLARLAPATDSARLAWGSVNVPLDGGGPSGDACLVMPGEPTIAAVIDGLGHGPRAAAASAAAVSALASDLPTDPESVVALAHRSMRSTRGAVIGACVIDADAGELSFVGVGNISARLLSDGTGRSMVSHGGTLGTAEALPAHQVFRYPWSPGATMILASDGLRSGWDAMSYPGLLDHDPAVVAAVLHRDFARPGDDASVLVLKDRREADDHSPNEHERSAT